jgi:hypothetical protein
MAVYTQLLGVTVCIWFHTEFFLLISEDYILPVDDLELNRLNAVHLGHRALRGGRTCLVPVPDDGRVLDVGTGSGIWAIEFADEHKAASVGQKLRGLLQVTNWNQGRWN